MLRTSLARSAVMAALVLAAAVSAQPPPAESQAPRADTVPADWVASPEKPEPGVQPGPMTGGTDETQMQIGDFQESPALRWLGDIRVADPNYDEVEPALTASPDGTLFIALEQHGATYDGWVRVYRSLNDGATWAWLVSFKSGSASRNPALAYAERSNGENWVYLAYESNSSDSSKGVVVIRFDPESPSNFDPVTVQSGLTGMPDIYPRVCTDNAIYVDNYYVYVTYAVYGVDYYPVMFARSVDFGLTYGTPQDITGGAESSTFVTRPDIAYGSAGLFAAFEKSGWNGTEWLTQVWVTRSTNFGGSWGAPVQLTTSPYGAWHPSVAAAVGTPSVMVAYTRDFSSDTDIHCAYSTDSGANYVLNRTLPWTNDVEKSVDLTVSISGGRYHAAYWRDYDLMYTSTDAASPLSWAATTVVNEANWFSSVYSVPSICANPTKPVAQEACVAWTDYRDPFYHVYFDAGFHDGACCFPDESCTETIESECTASGGTWQGAGVDCDPNPCFVDPCEDDTQPPVAALTLGDFQCVAAGGATAISGTATDPEDNLSEWLLEERGMGAAPWTVVASGTTPVTGVLANWTPAAAGYRMLRLTVQDACGHAATAVRLLYADQGPYAVINYPTAGTVVGGTSVCIDGLVGHGVCGMSWEVWYRPHGGAWVSLASGSSAVHNLPLAHWDTTTVPDGEYDIRVTASSIGGSLSKVVGVTVDNTAPTVAIDMPTNCTWVDGIVAVSGIVADTNLAQWTLQWTGGTSNGWNTIATGSTPVDGFIANWNVTGMLHCPYTLRLIASDEARLNCTNDTHWSEYLVSIRVGEPGGVADLDGDGDVDMVDFAIFAEDFTGPM